MSPARADVNPEVERDTQIARATEWLQIEVSAVWIEKLDAEMARIAASAVVKSVAKTASRLEPGDNLLIAFTLDFAAYERFMDDLRTQAENGIVGIGTPGLPIIPRAGRSYVAHMRLQTGPDLEGSVYSPAAAGYSFEVLDAELP
jgi:hypothetical protein